MEGEGHALCHAPNGLDDDEVAVGQLGRSVHSGIENWYKAISSPELIYLNSSTKMNLLDSLSHDYGLTWMAKSVINLLLKTINVTTVILSLWIMPSIVHWCKLGSDIDCHWCKKERPLYSIILMGLWHVEYVIATRFRAGRVQGYPGGHPLT